jgi:hypothetical protein
MRSNSAFNAADKIRKRGQENLVTKECPLIAVMSVDLLPSDYLLFPNQKRNTDSHKFKDDHEVETSLT